MRITIVLGAFLPVPPTMGGAVEKAWFSLGRQFAREGHEVVQISRALPGLATREVIEGVEHRRLRGYDTPSSLVRLKFLDLLYSIRVFFALPKGDIVVTNTFWLPILLRTSRRGKTYIHVARFPKGQMPFYSHADRLQTVSHSVAEAIRREARALAPKVSVIPYPVAQLPQPPMPIERRPLSLLFVGRVHPEKGLHLLLEALHKIAPRKLMEWSLTIVGPAERNLGGGGKKYLRALQSAAEVTPCPVRWAGAVFDEARLTEEFQRARIFVYPSLAERGESFGLAPLEAMANGCAVIVSDLACFRDFISEGKTGLTFDHRADSPAVALANRLADAIDDRALLARLSRAGYEKAAEYSVEKIARQYLADFQSLLTN